MDLFAASERLMTMDDTTWRRHASKLSIYTRFTCLPLLVLAIWSRVWLGWWSLLPIVLALVWTWANPRVFAPPKDRGWWGAKGTYGERVFLNRKAVPIPDHHRRWGIGLAIASGVGALPLIFGLIVLDPAWTVAGLIGTILPKVWFVDRMVWLYEDMKGAHPEYAKWEV